MESETRPKIIIDHRETLLRRIENSVGTKLFQTVVAYVDGIKVDLTKAGAVSCAKFVSEMLLLSHQGLAERPRATVVNLIPDLKRCGWYETDSLQPGSVLLWEERIQSDRKPHKHVGFYVGCNRAVSNNPDGDTPFNHHWTFNDTRAIEAVFGHKFLLSDL